ncbi:Uncharacterised protein [Legionella wadsworthii]|uniref:Methyltransferase domain-containing protein n=2 Tax=Legionella wadsworthii TaxID=28088 RepID=A0A378LQS7_9GAMM|nr:Uncharacterised protein [Legionella wadsworthii]
MLTNTFKNQNFDLLNQSNSNLVEIEKTVNETSISTPPNSFHSNHIIRLLKSASLKIEAQKVFLYAFADIGMEEVMKLIKTLEDAPIETSDPEVAGIIFKWYVSVKPEYKKGFAMTDKEYQYSKSGNIARILTSHLSSRGVKKLKGKSLLDIGAGDCAMTYLVSQQLEMEGNAIDVQMQIDWGGENSSDQKSKNDYMAKIDNYYVYDGKNLMDALKGKKFAVVMYNHSLHHFPSFQAQFESLKQASQILEPGGILFLSEHANCFNDEILDLSHLLLNLRYSIDKKQILTQSDADEAIIKFKNDYQSHYFSKNILDVMTQQLGLTLVKEEVRSSKDVSKATFFCFIKRSPRSELTYSPYFFDTDKASRLHHVIHSNHDDLPQKRYSAESFN